MLAAAVIRDDDVRIEATRSDRDSPARVSEPSTVERGNSPGVRPKGVIAMKGKRKADDPLGAAGWRDDETGEGSPV